MIGKVRRGLEYGVHRLLRVADVIETSPQRILNYRRYNRKNLNKKALLSFLVEPIAQELHGQRHSAFSNAGLGTAIPRVLNQMGYRTDIINWDDRDFNPSDQYDLVVVHGAKNYESLKLKLVGDPTIIYFSTGSYWKFHNQQEQKRFDYFWRRHNIRLPLDRFISEPEEQANHEADGIICLGNALCKDTYAGFSNVQNLNIASIPIPDRGGERDWSKVNKTFLFFSGGGNVHKGLDLLLDAVAGSDLQLRIGTKLDPEFEEFYREQLYESDNIQYLGFVPVGSPEFYQAVQEAGFVVLPSCSEGSPGSVVDCMQQGLIPVVTPDAHIDADEFGFVFGEATVDSVRQTLEMAAGQPVERLKTLSRAAKRSAARDYTVRGFDEALNSAIASILSARS
jgi:hypothetical protein